MTSDQYKQLLAETPQLVGYDTASIREAIRYKKIEDAAPKYDTLLSYFFFYNGFINQYEM